MPCLHCLLKTVLLEEPFTFSHAFLVNVGLQRYGRSRDGKGTGLSVRAHGVRGPSLAVLAAAGAPRIGG